jgi:hypothetical protein
MIPTKTSAGKNEVLRLGAMRLPPPLRTKWQSKAAMTRHLNKRTCHQAQSIYYPMISIFIKVAGPQTQNLIPRKKRRITSGTNQRPYFAGSPSRLRYKMFSGSRSICEVKHCQDRLVPHGGGPQRKSGCCIFCSFLHIQRPFFNPVASLSWVLWGRLLFPKPNAG